ncbi:MAG: sel1 repeat family protein, partial [Bacteroidales bacterium]|nr:sel1 repeat family protein [Bacteroidales bacterium]
MKRIFLSLLAGLLLLTSQGLSAQDASFYWKYANKGDKDAMYKLAECYFYGTGGVETNYSAALDWFEQAAKKGSLESQFMAAYCYFYGLGTSENFMITGMKLMNKAQKSNYAPAHWLAAQYWSAQGQRSLYLSNLKKAALGNYGNAQAEYGLLYLYGSDEYGITQDIPTGVSWLSKAVQYNNAEAMYHLGLCYEVGASVMKDFNKALEYYNSS